MAASYNTIAGRASAELVERKSRFIGQIAHVESEAEALAFLEQVRAANQTARHNVYAYVLRDVNGTADARLAAGEVPVERVRYSDDGEPAKTAGMPTLEVIQHTGLTDVIIVTTRYFGGILLGTGGLVRAYTQAAQAAIAAASTCTFTSCVDVLWVVPYALYEQAQRLCEAQQVRVLNAEFAADVQLECRMPAGSETAFLAAATELVHAEPDVLVGEPAMRMS